MGRAYFTIARVQCLSHRRPLCYDPWTKIPNDALSLLKKMMHPVPEKRITFEGIRRHRWFKRSNELMTQKGKCNDPVNLAEKLLQGLPSPVILTSK